MSTIFLIGNGFDLAHDIKSSYKDFFENLILNMKNEPEKYHKFASGLNSIPNIDDFYKSIDSFSFKNKLLKLFAKDFAKKKWCDIESVYFAEMMNMTEYENISELNNDFEDIKEELHNYLKINCNAYSPIKEYEDLFRLYRNKNLLIINFNYTSTVHSYISKLDIKNIHIHGTLSDDHKSIIFGFAPSDEKISDHRLLDNEYMHNIKRTSYNLNGKYKQILEFLEYADDGLNVIILGHSCGQSDNMILKDILGHKYVEDIQIRYFNSESYRDQFINLQKVLDEKDYDKIVNLEDSEPMPQSNNPDIIKRLL